MAADTAMTIKKSKKARIKPSTAIIYASVFVLFISVIAVGYQSPKHLSKNSPVANVATGNSVTLDEPSHSSTGLADDVVATAVAANVAAATGLSIEPLVSSRAISTKVQSEIAVADESAIAKPTILSFTSASRSIVNYTVEAGDTIDSVAAKFGLQKETIKWANNLTGDTLTVGIKLEILPRDGISYVVKSGDSLEALAAKYQANAVVIQTYNDIEIAGLTPGLRIIIPNAKLPLAEQPGYNRPTQFTGYSSGYSGAVKTWRIRSGTPMYAGNTYALGNCTAYVFDRRAELNKPVLARWGNASSWAISARNAGYLVNNIPSVGSVIQNGGGAGHVAIVEKILENGDLELSEMNASFGTGGWNIVSGRILPAENVGQYLYIH